MGTNYGHIFSVILLTDKKKSVCNIQRLASKSVFSIFLVLFRIKLSLHTEVYGYPLSKENHFQYGRLTAIPEIGFHFLILNRISLHFQINFWLAYVNVFCINIVISFWDIYVCSSNLTVAGNFQMPFSQKPKHLSANCW